MQQFIAENLLARTLTVERGLELFPDLPRDLLWQTLLRSLRDECPGCVPIRDVHREESANAAVAIQFPEHSEVAPELGLRDRSQRPRRIGIKNVAADEQHVLVKEVLDAHHPRHEVVGVQRAQAFESRIKRTHLWRD